MEKQPILALELLGTVLELGRGGLWDSRVRPEAKRLLSALVDHCHILIHSVLVSDDNSLLPSEDQAKTLEQYLRAQGIPWDYIWCRPGKPQADFYAETFDDLQRFHDAVLSKLPERLTPGSVQEASAGVQGMRECVAEIQESPVQAGMAAGKGTTR